MGVDCTNIISSDYNIIILITICAINWSGVLIISHNCFAFCTDIVSAIQENDNYILSEAKDGISFLNGREEFWKQQKLIN